jgi:hypothetical protein
MRTDHDTDTPALAPGDLPDALAGARWALDLAHDWLEDYGARDYDQADRRTLARRLEAARDLLDDLEAQA